MKVSVYRYNPETDREPYMQDVNVELPAGKDLMVLDVLNLIKEKIRLWSIVAHAVKEFAVAMV